MKARRMAAGAFAIAPFGLLLATGPQAQKVSYAADIAPIFKAHCANCHSGADSAGKLDLSSGKALANGGQSGKEFVAGKPEESLLMIRLLGKGGKPQMPMGFPALTKPQLDLIENWIKQGASLVGADKVTHWSYIKPVRPALPAVKEAKWVQNPIDRFVLAKLESNGLHPSPEASKETLIRRVSLDLTGLPPTVKEIDAFLADKRPDAYDRLVDRLMESPHYGERQARPWLDLARYADSDGYEKDLNRTAWKYRDWVINAFNKNMPYDQFTIQQLAGDLLPFKDYSQLVATGFNRNTMFNREGGVDQAEAHFNVVLDRVNTTATVWLGSTLQCARCHDHKYDPFTQQDFYKMSAYFGNSVILPRGPASLGEEKWFESEMQIPSGEQVAEKTKLLNRLDKLNRERDDAIQAQSADFEAWRAAIREGTNWSRLDGATSQTTSGATLVKQPDGSLLATGAIPDTDTYTISGKLPPGSYNSFRIEAIPDHSLYDNGPGRAGNFVLTGLDIEVDGHSAQLSDAFADFSQEGFDAKNPLTRDAKAGWAIHPQRGRNHVLVVSLKDPISVAADSTVKIVLEQKYARALQHVLGRFRLSFANTIHPDAFALSPEVEKLAMLKEPNPQQEKMLRAFFYDHSAATESLRAELVKNQTDLNNLNNEVPTALIMKDKPATGPLTAYVHVRGEFLNKAEQVTAGTPAVFGPDSPSLPSNRLGLAEWITSKDNPLTARVQVNRIWEQYFGRGIVETSEDFGTQGSKPSNQELLDWLATEFMAKNWDMKAIHRLIVTSATYKQTSNATPELMKRDPQNLLLARGPRFRMEAEMIRDSALTEAGILDPQIGGPSVYPLQPAGVWDVPYDDAGWTTSSGGEALRRGIYTFWKRSAPYPSFMAFDATSREECTVRRIRTNTPLQALELLNDEAMFVAARALGKEMEHSKADEKDRLIYGFRTCTGRYPTAKETTRLEGLFTKLTDRYRANPTAAKKVAGTATDAAYTLTANVLLNLDETITKG